MAQRREQFTSEELAIVLSNYDLGIVTSVDAFPRGSHAAAKVVITTDRGRFLLKRRPKGQFDQYRVAFAHDLQRFLATRNFPLPHLIGTRNQNISMLKIDDAIYEVFEFISGGPYEGGLVTSYEAAKMLGLYHRLVREFHPKWKPPRGHYHGSKTVYDSFKPLAKVLSKTDSARDRQRELIDLLKELRKAYTRAAKAVDALGLPEWETQIVHSDWHPGNMLFDRGHVVAVIDYDAARIQPRVMDVANGCLQFSIVTGGRDLSTWKAHTDQLRAKRFLRGYDEVNILSKAELEAVPFLMQEVLVAQAIRPILKTGTFAGLDGFKFLQVILRKIQWLQENRDRLALDTPDE